MSDTVVTVNSAPLSLADFWDPLYDSFDVDLIMKVLSHTAFSELDLPHGSCPHD